MFPILLSLVLRSVLEVSHLLLLAPATSSHVVSLSSKAISSKEISISHVLWFLWHLDLVPYRGTGGLYCLEVEPG